MFEFHYCEPFGRFPTVAAQFPDEDAALVAGMLHLAIQLNEPVPPEGACNVFVFFLLLAISRLARSALGQLQMRIYC